MKKLFLLLASILMLSTVNIKAQITLDTIIVNTYSGMGTGFRAVQISPTETKWYFQDTTANTFSLYNMDFTPFMLNIGVPEPFQPTNIGFNALYISRALFDCDTSNIEYAYEAPLCPIKPFRIVRTDGTILFQLDSANGPYTYGGIMGGADVLRPIINTSSGARLFLKKYTPVYGPEPIFVYSLCGTLIDDVFDFKETNQSYVQIFPNPASSTLTFAINLPDNLNQYELIIHNSNAQELRREKMGMPSNRYALNVQDYSSGTYYYSLASKNKLLQTGKFVITK